MSLDEKTRNEVREIVRATVAEMELRTVKAMNELQIEIAQIPHHIAGAISSCQSKQESKRRWSTGIAISLAAVAASIITFIASLYAS
jgi:hypothetical protein